MTASTFCPGRTKDGLVSYEVLAQTLQPYVDRNVTVVDLACGDGHLFQFVLPRLTPGSRLLGIDMSPEELAVARQNQDPRVHLFLKLASDTGCASRSVDAILCHMALMLMEPIEPVVSEIARLLKPGGCFSAIVGSSQRGAGFLEEMSAEIRKFLLSIFPLYRETKVGDPRVYHLSGLKELFRADLGFSSNIRSEKFEIHFDLTPEEVWNYNKEMYFIGMLKDEPKERLKKHLLEFTESRKDSRGRVQFSYPMEKITVWAN